MAGWPPVGGVAARSACGVFSWYKYLIVSLVFSHLGFWSGSLFLIAPFLDLCLLVPFFNQNLVIIMTFRQTLILMIYFSYNDYSIILYYLYSM